MRLRDQQAEMPLLKFTGKITAVVVTNMLWLLCCLPVFTIGASTRALYVNMSLFLAGEECGIRTFFKAFAKDFRRVTGLWLVILVAAVALVADYCIVAYLDFPGRMVAIGLIFFVGFLLLFFSSLTFPMLSQFSMSVKDAAINGVLLSLAHLPKVLMVTAVNLIPWVLLLVSTKWFLMLTMLWVCCAFSLMGIYALKILEPAFAPYRETEKE